MSRLPLALLAAAALLGGCVERERIVYRDRGHAHPRYGLYDDGPGYRGQAQRRYGSYDDGPGRRGRGRDRDFCPPGLAKKGWC